MHHLLQRWKIPLYSLFVLTIGFGSYLYQNHNKTPYTIHITQQQTKTFQITLTGAISKPGVYEIEAGTNLKTLLAMAGGLDANADIDGVSLSETLDPQTKNITIPFKRKKSKTPYVNLNTATQHQLQTLPGIGPKTAHHIIQYRDTYGPFQSKEALRAIKGIGKKKFEKLAPYIRIEE